MSPAGILNGTKLDAAGWECGRRLHRQSTRGQTPGSTAQWWLDAELRQPKYPPIQGLEEIEVFGVVTWSLTLHVP
jgi:DNA polymerase V